MFLGTYRFEGNPDEIAQAYDRAFAALPRSGLTLHVCVKDDKGLWIYDTCPSKEAFVAFANSPELRGALTAAGLPAPVVTTVGQVHAAFVSGQSVPIA